MLHLDAADLTIAIIAPPFQGGCRVTLTADEAHEILRDTRIALSHPVWSARDRLAIARGEAIARRPFCDLYVSASQ